MLETRDREYQDKVSKAIVEAVFMASLDPAQKIAFIQSGEVSVACLMQIALMAATSEVTASPTKTRHFCETVAKRLLKMIGEAKREIAENGSPMRVVTVPRHDFVN